MTQSAAPVASERRYDLDWLRVIAFGLLIFYHIGMFYVPWDFHVTSEHVSETSVPLMLLLNPWRLALLFFISGIAFRYAADKTAPRTMVAKRLWRLGVPLLFGAFVIVPPQTYFELLSRSAIEPGYGGFWLQYMEPGLMDGIITPTWNHLWYVAYVLVYSLLLLPVLPALRPLGTRVARLLGSPWRLLILAPIPFVLSWWLLSPQFPTTHNLVWDWANHAQRLTAFVLGVLIAKEERFWTVVDRALPWAMVMAVLTAALFLVYRLFLPGLDAQLGYAAVSAILASRIWYAWAVIVALLGLARRFLYRPGPALRYLTAAVFPYYILHQTIIITVGFTLTGHMPGAWSEFAVIVAATVAGCAVLYEGLIRRVRILRPLFGVPDSAAPARRDRATA